METQTIISIKNTCEEIKEKIRNADFKNNTTNTYGNENEYNFKGLVGGIDSLITDITTLTRHHNKFIRVSTYDERNNILSYLTRINTYFETPANYIPQFDELKKILRNYDIRYFEDRVLNFDSEISELVKNKIIFIENNKEIIDLKNNAKEHYEKIEERLNESEELIKNLNAEIETLTEKKKNLILEIEDLEEKNEEITKIKDEVIINSKEIVTLLTESKGNEKLIKNFALNVQNRDNRLIELEENIVESNSKIESYEQERSNILKQADDLINSAKQALNYKTAEGISASFQEQYKLANNRYVLFGWIIGSLIFIVGTLLMGMWIIYTHQKDDNIGLIISRISLIPILIIGAVFCANQYTKQKNIIEDYAYKMVLSKAIVGFSEQLKKNQTSNDEEYVHYIKTALMEIHKDPLRKRDKKENSVPSNSNIKELVEIIEKLKNLTQIN